MCQLRNDYDAEPIIRADLARKAARGRSIQTLGHTCCARALRSVRPKPQKRYWLPVKTSSASACSNRRPWRVPTSKARFFRARSATLSGTGAFSIAPFLSAAPLSVAFFVARHLPTAVLSSAGLSSVSSLPTISPHRALRLTRCSTAAPQQTVRVGMICFRTVCPNPPVERDRREAPLLGSLRAFAASAAPHLAR